ncbi:energy-coupling factor ABC transporter ATP-binding protein [Bradyrhizobium zhanjiangense]|uniref:ATP-binding cassette domain-containing protein n=1 Tax=Bradyrhizobium zhanjiangense TaxID=1325107 RepID=A0A4Q0Q8G9_9BRAD|nr:energy-coupling factor ABC transporter ATP-binding protein [Bradyrhizobium zhanjiangense]RXG85778.1 ATP-binding cassette domain-containing protein [Bradyrhizobium zhanjiangense]
MIEAARREAPPASRPHLRGVAEGIIFEDVQFRRADRQVLAISELRLAERRVGLIGDNGSGKSTMLRLMNGLLLPTRGCVEVEGLDTVRHRKDLPAKVGFLFQNPDHQLIFPTVAEEVAFGPAERGKSARQARQQAIALLERHRCGEWADRNVNELSGGQKQLVCILALLATEPSILLMDEPFSSLDLPTRLLLYRRIMALPEQVVMATHDFELLPAFDRVIWLDEGRIRLDGRPAEVLPAYRAHATIVGAGDALTS